MKTETALVPITRYRDDDGAPICGGCNKGVSHTYRCFIVEGNRDIPGPTCPIWQPGVTVVGEEEKS